MQKDLIKLACEQLELAKKVTDHYDSYLADSQMDMWSPIPIDSRACEAIGEFIKTLGQRRDHFELVGIGQCLLSQSQELREQELQYQETDEELYSAFVAEAEKYAPQSLKRQRTTK